jgi:hypothetical protein
MVIFTFSSLMPRSSNDRRQTTAMSEHRFAATAEARCFHGCDLQAAAQFVDDERRSASPSTSSAMIRSERPACTTASRMGNMACSEESFFVNENLGSSNSQTILSALVMKQGELRRDRTACLLRFQLGLEALGLHRDHAFIADLRHGVGDHFADRGVSVRRDGANLPISC